jgi:thermitase
MPRAGLPEAAMNNILRENGAGKGQRVGRSELRIVSVPPGQERNTVERLSQNPHVKFAELDTIVESNLATNDPMAGSQWHLPKISAPTAWDTAQGSGVTIAILDSGIDTKHPDFVGRLVPGYNFVDGNTDLTDVKDHGTKAAGSAAAAMNNGVGVASVAGVAKIMPLRVSNSDGTASISTVAKALTWAADNGARIANMSFNQVASSSSILSAADYLKSKGGLSFVSAGNSNVDPGYANTNSIIIVSATTSSDTKASFSNFGDHVHLSAPGSGIYTTTWGQSYASVSGTSFSAPIAAGVAALVMSANPSLTNAQVEKILFSTAVDLGTAGRDIYFGYGRVNAAAAVAAAKSMTSTADTAPPAASIAAPLDSSTVTALVPVNVTATDNVGVTKVELWVNSSLVGTDTSAPYAFSWDSSKVGNGSHKVMARAYDASGNRSDSAAVSVYVSNTTTVTADITPPKVAISNPVNGAVIGSAVTISVAASDNAGASGIQQTLTINGKTVASATGGTLSYKWNTRKLASGYYQIAAVARDAAGNSMSTSITVRK